jgi:hypothetical protein
VKTRNSMILWMIILGILVALPVGSGRAQDTAKPAAESKPAAEARSQSVYHLAFVVRELEGEKQINSRSYSFSVRDHDWGKTRMRGEVPIQLNESNVSSRSVGISIDCQVQERDNTVLLSSRFGISSIASPQEVSVRSTYPVFRTLDLDEQSEVPLGKPTVIGKLDDVTTNHRFEIEVTATKVK